ncbi:heparan-alpha-glucosaminide N-acetyltransferase [Pseudovibrio exalbescens]|uniref:DUF1624 domain-containing protein n=1 Tax=Pseudovibrio exalbescens TaxID=197461 RepID=UPI002366EEFC|nr:heparan-alpha-glucosaminide N-acetyltransferase [Pseudovibrio exalbescens]MDD7910229.1 heparan-alpha-glucosaminide N-acetyltransferase [Pseudovibrio exalbescens]
MNRPKAAEMGQTTRLPWLDIARGAALWAMVLYHFSWDLLWFGLVDWPVATGMGWRSFAIGIAASFLFLVGFSANLAHGKGIRWKGFWKREAKIVAAAVLVSAGTYFALGSQMIRFGILHNIALSSLLVLLFLRLPFLLNTLIGLAVIALGNAVSPLAPDPLLFWIGLHPSPFVSVDFVPVFPWFGVVLLGLAASQYYTAMKLRRRAQELPEPPPRRLLPRAMGWSGRNSLFFYLAHQPILFGSLWLLVALGGLPDRDEMAFQSNCVAACVSSHEASQCETACACTLERLQQGDEWERLLNEPLNATLRPVIQQHFQICLAQ